MKLSEWCGQQKVSPAHFGRALGVASRATVSRYISGQRIPRPSIMAQIVALTGGLVTPNDFHGCAPAAETGGEPSSAARASHDSAETLGCAA